MSFNIAKGDIENELLTMEKTLDALNDQEVKRNYIKLHMAVNKHQQHLFRINQYLTKRIKEL